MKFTESPFCSDLLTVHCTAETLFGNRPQNPFSSTFSHTWTTILQNLQKLITAEWCATRGSPPAQRSNGTTMTTRTETGCSNGDPSQTVRFWWPRKTNFIDQINNNPIQSYEQIYYRGGKAQVRIVLFYRRSETVFRSRWRQKQIGEYEPRKKVYGNSGAEQWTLHFWEIKKLKFQTNIQKHF